MRNARKELEQLLEGKAKIKCASIGKCSQYDYKKLYKKFELKVNHTEEELESFLKSLDFEYDAGFGTQELRGIIWLEDDSWCTRGEYYGSEWWIYHQRPEIPEELL